MIVGCLKSCDEPAMVSVPAVDVVCPSGSAVRGTFLGGGPADMSLVVICAAKCGGALVAGAVLVSCCVWSVSMGSGPCEGLRCAGVSWPCIVVCPVMLMSSAGGCSVGGAPGMCAL